MIQLFTVSALLVFCFFFFIQLDSEIQEETSIICEEFTS